MRIKTNLTTCPTTIRVCQKFVRRHHCMSHYSICLSEVRQKTSLHVPVQDMSVRSPSENITAGPTTGLQGMSVREHYRRVHYKTYSSGRHHAWSHCRTCRSESIAEGFIRGHVRQEGIKAGPTIGRYQQGRQSCHI